MTYLILIILILLTLVTYLYCGLLIIFIFSEKKYININEYNKVQIIPSIAGFPFIILYVLIIKPIMFFVKNHKGRYDGLTPTQIRKAKLKKLNKHFLKLW